MTDSPRDGREDATLFPTTPGERLKAAREAQQLSLADIAQRTRVPTRHLEAIESGDYGELPSPTYAIGFAKAYARAVDLDEVAIGRDVRAQAGAPPRPTMADMPYEPADPARLPPAGLAIGGVILALILVVGVAIWMGSGWFGGDDAAAPVTSAQIAPSTMAVPQPTPTPKAAGGQVALIATDAVWLRVYDADDNTLFMKEMAAGDRFDVPVDAKQPMINVGRPDKLEIRLNGSVLPPLGDGSRPIKDVGVSAAAVRARLAEADAAAAPAGTTGGTTAERPVR